MEIDFNCRHKISLGSWFSSSGLLKKYIPGNKSVLPLKTDIHWIVIENSFPLKD